MQYRAAADLTAPWCVVSNSFPFDLFRSHVCALRTTNNDELQVANNADRSKVDDGPDQSAAEGGLRIVLFILFVYG